jgi:hypothetical protein
MAPAKKFLMARACSSADDASASHSQAGRGSCWLCGPARPTHPLAQAVRGEQQAGRAGRARHWLGGTLVQDVQQLFRGSGCKPPPGPPAAWQGAAAHTADAPGRAWRQLAHAPYLLSCFPHAAASGQRAALQLGRPTPPDGETTLARHSPPQHACCAMHAWGVSKNSHTHCNLLCAARRARPRPPAAIK